MYPFNASINQVQCMVHGAWNIAFPIEEIIYYVICVKQFAFHYSSWWHIYFFPFNASINQVQSMIHDTSNITISR